jgi:hypothetical protein
MHSSALVLRNFPFSTATLFLAITHFISFLLRETDPGGRRRKQRRQEPIPVLRRCWSRSIQAEHLINFLFRCLVWCLPTRWIKQPRRFPHPTTPVSFLTNFLVLRCPILPSLYFPFGTSLVFIPYCRGFGTETAEETGMQQIASDLQALKSLYGLLHKGDENVRNYL